MNTFVPAASYISPSFPFNYQSTTAFPSRKISPNHLYTPTGAGPRLSDSARLFARIGQMLGVKLFKKTLHHMLQAGFDILSQLLRFFLSGTERERGSFHDQCLSTPVNVSPREEPPYQAL